MWRAAAVAVWLVGCWGGQAQPQQPQVENRAPAPPAATQPSGDDRKAEQAHADADQARVEAAEARAKLDALQRDVDDLDRRIDVAVTQIADAQDQAQRKAARAELQKLQMEKAELDARIKAAKEDAQRAERKKSGQVSPKCQDDPLAHDCI